jgi:hypothetical protein
MGEQNKVRGPLSEEELKAIREGRLTINALALNDGYIAALARVEEMDAALGWKEIDRKQYPKNHEIMSHSRSYMVDLVEMLKEQLSYALAERDSAQATAKYNRITTEEWRARAEQAEAERFVPGHLECVKCNFLLISKTLYVGSGTVGSNDTPAQCSNGCGPMWRVSWKRHSEKMHESLEALLVRAEEAEAMAESHKKAWVERVDQVIALRAENSTLGETLAFVRKGLRERCDELAALRAENERYRETLRLIGEFKNRSVISNQDIFYQSQLAEKALNPKEKKS